MTEPWWSEFPDTPRTSQVLEVDECMALLAGHRVGRLAYSGPFGVRIVPLSYTVQDRALLFRTAVGSHAALTIPRQWVAFEVDELDETLREGWSVQVHGFVELLPVYALGLLDPRQTPRPWVSGDRSVVLRLPVTEVTGRRIGS